MRSTHSTNNTPLESAITQKVLSIFPKFLIIISLLSTGLHASTEETNPWTSLFDGKTLNGWSNPYEWGQAEVVDGEIHLKAKKKFFLVYEKQFSDFILEVELRMPKGKANSGVMFRCHQKPNKVFGYQAECDPSDRKWSGGLYDEGRRKWLNPIKGDEASIAAFREKAGECLKRHDWNKFKITCKGDHIKIEVNGVLTTDYHDSMDAIGYIALQHHGEKGQTYKFRNIRIKEIK